MWITLTLSMLAVGAGAADAAPGSTRVKKQFEYPEEVDNISAIFRIELEPNSRKKMYYTITPKTTDCTIDLEYYISEWGPSNPSEITATINFIDSKGRSVQDFNFDSKTRTPIKSTLTLDKVGEYGCDVANNSSTGVIVDLIFGMNKCHTLKHKMHKDDIEKFKERVQDLFKEHVSLINENLASRHRVNNRFNRTVSDMHSGLFYSTVLEIFLIVVLSIAQLFYLKRLLESKQLI